MRLSAILAVALCACSSAPPSNSADDAAITDIVVTATRVAGTHQIKLKVERP